MLSRHYKLLSKPISTPSESTQFLDFLSAELFHNLKKRDNDKSSSFTICFISILTVGIPFHFVSSNLSDIVFPLSRRQRSFCGAPFGFGVSRYPLVAQLGWPGASGIVGADDGSGRRVAAP